VVPAPTDTGQRGRLQWLRLRVLHHQERPVVHDEPSRARRRFEVCQLRHGGHDPAFAARGQALRLRRPQLRPYVKAVHSPGPIPIYVSGLILPTPLRIFIHRSAWKECSGKSAWAVYKMR
jgi:hypothetical protein